MNVLLEMAQPFIYFLLDAACKSSLLFALLHVADHLLPSAQAAWRNLLWRMGVIGLLLIPASSALLPVVYVPVSAPWSQTPVVQFALQSASAPVSATSARAPTPFITAPAPRPMADSRETPLAPSPSLDPKQVSVALAAALYLAGLLFILMRLGAAMISVSRLRRHAVEVADERYLHHLRSLKTRLGLRAPVLLGTSETLSGPTQVGCVHPLILLPTQTLASMEEDRISTILAHELAHVHRGDYLFNLVAGLALALHWFNPLAWLGVRRLRQTSEQACDDWTVEMLGDCDHYARTLVAVAAGALHEKTMPLGANMASPSRVSQRIERILTLGGRVSPHIGRIPGTALAAVLICGTLALGASEVSSDIPPPLARLLYVTQERSTNEYTVTGVAGCALPSSEILCYYPDGSHEMVAKTGEDGAFAFNLPYEKGPNGIGIRVRDQYGLLSPATDPRIDKPLIGGSEREPNELGWANLAPASADEEKSAKAYEHYRKISRKAREKQERWRQSIGKTWEQVIDERISIPDSVAPSPSGMTKQEKWLQAIGKSVRQVLEEQMPVPDSISPSRPDLFQVLINGDGPPEDLKIYGYTPAGRWVTCVARQSGRSFAAQVREDGRFSVVIPQDAVDIPPPNRVFPFLVVNVTDSKNQLLATSTAFGPPQWAWSQRMAKDRESLLNQPAPDFSLKSLDEKDTVHIGALSGHNLLIYFWASGNPSCLADLPVLQKLYSTLDKEKVLLLTIHTYRWRQTRHQVQSLLEENGYTFPVLDNTPPLLQDLYKLWSDRRAIVVDRSGIVRFVEDDSLSEERLRTAIAEYTN